ncbi:ABC transporter substrate-binding protein [Cohnella sp. GCM10027633]|uniref:ABC transporter substrate-binding protein n=1 Tax=unclassified Cohnella TaxID=2636738 RepID=UPI00362FFB9F
MRSKFSVAVAAIALTVLASCAGGETQKPVKVAEVRFPVYSLFGGALTAEGGSGVPDKNDAMAMINYQERMYVEAAYNFNKLNPDIKVVIDTLDWNDEQTPFSSPLPLLEGDSPTDIVRIHFNYDYDRIAAESPELLYDLASMHDATGATIPSEYIEWAKKDGKLLMLPNHLYPTALAYNKDVFDRAQVPYPEGEMTWAQFADVARKINGAGTGARALGEYPFYFFTKMLGETGRSLLSSDGKTTVGYLDGEAAIDAVGSLKDIVNAAVDVQRSASGFFAPGNVAFGIGGINVATSGDAKDGARVGIVSMPYAEGTVRTVDVSYGGYAISGKSRHPEAAWAFIKYLAIDANEDSLKINQDRVPASAAIADGVRLGASPELAFYLDEAKHAAIIGNDAKFYEAWTRELEERFNTILTADDDEISERLHKLALEVDEKLAEAEKSAANPTKTAE